MAVLGAGIDMQLRDHLPTELGLGQHPLDCLDDKLFRVPGALFTRGPRAQAARIACVPVIDLVVFLRAGSVLPCRH